MHTYQKSADDLRAPRRAQPAVLPCAGRRTAQALPGAPSQGMCCLPIWPFQNLSGTMLDLLTTDAGVSFFSDPARDQRGNCCTDVRVFCLCHARWLPALLCGNRAPSALDHIACSEWPTLDCLTEAVLEGSGSAPAIRQCMSRRTTLGTCLHKAHVKMFLAPLLPGNV